MIRTGPWQSALADLGSCDAVITDPPYGSRTHAGARSNCAERSEGVAYDVFTPLQVLELVFSWASRTRRWIVALTSHDLIPAYEDAYAAIGWYSFAPVAIVARNPTPRMAGDGPTSSTVYAMVARPRTREAMTWRSLPGHYVVPAATGGNGRGKPEELCCALVRDYSDPGDLVVDPFAGLGGIVRAANGMGRRSIGAEIDPVVARDANSRREQMVML